MLKRDLYFKLKKDFPHLKNETIKGALDVVFETITQGLVDRRDTVIRGLGSFVTYERPMPISHLPGKVVTEGETFISIKYYPSSGLKKRLNNVPNLPTD
jgi:nucleoid DNA-binding protein